MTHVELNGDQIVTLVKARDILDEKGLVEAREAVLAVLRSAVLVTTKNPIYERADTHMPTRDLDA